MRRTGFRTISEINPQVPSGKERNEDTWIMCPNKVKLLQKISGEHMEQKYCCCNFLKAPVFFNPVQHEGFMDRLGESIHRMWPRANFIASVP